MSQNLRLLYLNYEYPPIGGGGGTTTRFLAEAIAAQGHDVTVLTGGIPGHYGIERVSDTLVVERLQTTRRRPDACTIPQMGLYIAHASLKLPARIRELSPDLIHVFFSFPTGAIAWWARLIYPQPYVVSLLGGDVPGADPEVTTMHRLLMPFTRSLWKHAGAVVPNSQRLGDLAGDVIEMPFPVITNGVDLSVFHPSEDVQRSPLLRFLFVGRLVKQKGLDILLHALAEAGDRIPGWELTVVGDGPLREEYTALAEQLGIADPVTWRGWVDFSELPGLYRSHDIFVLPSRYEGMPSVVLQAMASGCAVLANHVFGIDEIVRQGENGYYADLDDPADFRHKLIAISTAADLEAMKSRSIEHAAQFSWESIAGKYIDLYRDILSWHHRKRK